MAHTLRGELPDGLVFHADRGCQFTSTQMWQVCQELGIAQQVGRTGVCFDTAMSESLWPTLNTEFSDRKSWATRKQARKAVAHWIEVVYKRRRRHSAIGMISPVSIKSQITEGKTPKTAANTKAA